MRGKRTRNWSIRALALPGVLAAVGIGALVGTAQATSPGENGQIAFRRYFNEEHTWGAIFVSNADGTGVRQVTRPPRGVFDDQPDWSPNGSLIAFSRCAPNLPCGIYTVRPDGTKLKRLSTPLARTRSHDTP